jgi:hypothetical protein
MMLALNAGCEGLDQQVCYWRVQACNDSFRKIDISPGICDVVRLAHKLDVPDLLGKLDSYLSTSGKLVLPLVANCRPKLTACPLCVTVMPKFYAVLLPCSSI